MTIPRLYTLLDSYGKRKRRELRQQAIALAFAVNDPKKLDEVVPPEKAGARRGDDPDFQYDDVDDKPWWPEGD